jgi:hypothetical protein
MRKKVKKYFNFVSLLVVCFFVFSPVFVYGIGLYTPQPKYDVITKETDILSRMAIVIGYVYNILFVVATIFFLVSLYGYLTAQGSPDKIKKVTKQLLYAVIAMVGGLFSFAITKIIEGILG